MVDVGYQLPRILKEFDIWKKKTGFNQLLRYFIQIIVHCTAVTLFYTIALSAYNVESSLVLYKVQSKIEFFRKIRSLFKILNKFSSSVNMCVFFHSIPTDVHLATKTGL